MFKLILKGKKETTFMFSLIPKWKNRDYNQYCVKGHGWVCMHQRCWVIQIYYLLLWNIVCCNFKTWNIWTKLLFQIEQSRNAAHRQAFDNQHVFRIEFSIPSQYQVQLILNQKACSIFRSLPLYLYPLGHTMKNLSP